MKKFVVIGSCLSNLPGIFLENDYGFRRLNNAIVHNSRVFLDHCIKQTTRMPPAEELIRALHLETAPVEAGLRQTLVEWVLQHYREHSGRHEMPAHIPSLFETIENDTLDLIMMDNLLDLRIPAWSYSGKAFENFNFAFSVHDPLFSHIANDFFEIPTLTAEQSINNWIEIIDFVRTKQPQAEIFFTCTPAVINENRPDLENIAQEFHARLSQLARTRNIIVAPPLEVPRELTKLPEDREHLDSRVYKALAAHAFLSVELRRSPLFYSSPAPLRDRPNPSLTPIAAEPRQVERSLRSVIAQELDIAPDLLTERSGAYETPNWDSLRQFAVILQVEVSFGVRFSFAETQSATTVEAIRAVLTRHGVYDIETTSLPAGSPQVNLVPAASAAMPQEIRLSKRIDANRNNIFGGFVARALAEPDRRFALLVKSQREYELSNGHILATAMAWGRRLDQIEPGAIVALVLDHSEHLYSAFIGCILRGIVPTFLPPMTVKQDPAIFRESMLTLFDRVRPAAVIATAATASSIPSDDRPILFAEDTTPAPWSELISAAEQLCVGNELDALAFLQHSSGTTSHKKGVMLSHRAVLDHIAAYGACVGIAPGDRIASWLPLYHDMGLITSFIMPTIIGCPVISLDAQEWVVQPTMLLDYIEREQANYVWLPNFAFHHIVKTDRREKSCDLSSIKAIVSCSEPCRKAAFDAFLDRYGTMGLDRSKLQVSYAMAENVFGVTQTRLGATVREGYEGLAKPYVSCGVPVEGVEMELRDQEGNRVPDGQPGEICLRSPFLMKGYFRLPDLTETRLRAGWYHTGDIGLFQDGELFVIGRSDDMIIVNGRNIVAHEAEDALNTIDELSPGRHILFSRHDESVGSESLIVLSESKGDPATWPGISAKVRRFLFSICNLPVAEVHLLPSGFLVKSSSGKLARKASIEKFLGHAQSSKVYGVWEVPLATATTPEEMRTALANREAQIGKSRALAESIHLYMAGSVAPGVAQVLAEAWCELGTPTSLLAPDDRRSLFLSVESHWQLRIVYGLAEADELDEAAQLSDLIGPPLNAALNATIDLNVARKTFRQKKSLNSLAFLERVATQQDWRFLRELVRYDIPNANLAAYSLSWENGQISIDDLHSLQLITSRRSKIYPEINSRVFRGDAKAEQHASSLPMEIVLSSVEQMIDRMQFDKAREMLKILVDWSYLFRDEPFYKRAFAALLIKMIDADAAISTGSLAYLLGELAELNAGRFIAKLILRATIDSDHDINPHTYFLLRRAYLMSSDETIAGLVAAKIASMLPAAGHSSAKRDYFIAGRAPQGDGRDIGWQQGKIQALFDELGIEIHFGARKSPVQPPPHKRVAIFLTGQLRSFEGVFENLRREVLEPLQADLFIATWDSPGFALGAHNDVSRLVNRNILEALPSSLQSRDGFAARFPKTMAFLLGAKEESIAAIRSVAGDATYAIVDEKAFEETVLRDFPAEVTNGKIERVRLNQFKMFFLNRVCGEMLDRAGTQYDWVVRMRPDMDVHSFVHSLLTERKADENQVTVQGLHPVGISDQFAYGSSRAMRHYFSGYDFLLENGGFRDNGFFRGLYGEAHLFDCLSYWGIRVSFTPTIRCTLRATRLTDHELAQLLLGDCSEEDADNISETLQRLL